MTSNIGSNLIMDNFANIDQSDNIKEVVNRTQHDVFEMLKQRMRPEFLNRIDELIMFQPLTMENMYQIVEIQFKEIQNRLEENGIVVDASKEVLKYLAEQGYDPQFGARPLKRVIQNLLLNDLSKEIISGKIQQDAVVGVTLDEEQKIKFFNVEKVDLS